MQDAFFDDVEMGEDTGRLRRALHLYVKWGAAILSLMVLGLVVVWAYRLGVRDAREIPVIQALKDPEESVRSAAAERLGGGAAQGAGQELADPE